MVQAEVKHDSSGEKSKAVHLQQKQDENATLSSHCEYRLVKGLSGGSQFDVVMGMVESRNV